MQWLGICSRCATANCALGVLTPFGRALALLHNGYGGVLEGCGHALRRHAMSRSLLVYLRQSVDVPHPTTGKGTARIRRSSAVGWGAKPARRGSPTICLLWGVNSVCAVSGMYFGTGSALAIWRLGGQLPHQGCVDSLQPAGALRSRRHRLYAMAGHLRSLCHSQLRAWSAQPTRQRTSAVAQWLSRSAGRLRTRIEEAWNAGVAIGLPQAICGHASAHHRTRDGTHQAFVCS